ncbi:MAG: ATP-binding protein [Solirubrobacteraceae bacterium]
MRTGSLRRRTVLATLAVLVTTLGAFAALVTVRYRDGLRRQARSQLLAGAHAIKLDSNGQLKSLIASLALEGINVEFGAAPETNIVRAPASRPVKPGQTASGIFRPGVLGSSAHLLTYSERMRLNGKVVPVTLSSNEASVDEAVHRLIVTELIGAAVVLVAGAALTWLALGSALAPLRHVAAVAQRIAHGDHRQRLRPRRPDTELGRMAASFDAMVDSLEEAATQATRSEAAMRRFLADASHELRTPIAALQASTETLLREQPQRPERDRLEAELARSSQRLGRLIDDLLNLARLEANEPLRAERVNLVELSDHVIAAARTHTPARITLAHDGPATVLGDPDALARALRNILDNAINAAGEHGEIHVDITSSPTHTHVSVADNGPGVPRAERERIFDGFVRLNATSGTGTGLGLAITRAIAHQHHGEISCNDTDAGARFTLELPTADSGEPHL